MNKTLLSAWKVLKVILMALFIIVSILSCKQRTKIIQPVLGAKSVKILNLDGLQFKDLNKNGNLDPYEDWRLSADERSKDLLSKMSVEEKAGFMMINSLNMVGTKAANESEGKLLASDLSEGGESGFGVGGGPVQSRPQNPDSLARQGAGNTAREREQNQDGAFIANMNRAAGTSTIVKEYHNRHFILRANESVRVTAEWVNKLQELCESEPLGIPAIIASNPRNNITTNASLGTSVGTTVFTSWPGELGLSAMRDLDLFR